MKYFFSNFLNLITKRYFIFLFSFCKGYENVVIFDIDNTLTKYKPGLNLKSQIRRPEIRKKIITLLYNYRSNKSKIILLSARGVSNYFTTLAWAFENKLIINIQDLILVPKPEDKLYFLNKAISKNQKVTLFDDFSYGHENGELHFYENVIEKVLLLNLTYYGCDYIEKISK
jgi:hypothetical protein